MFGALAPFFLYFMEPKILVANDDVGEHNKDLKESIKRIEQSNMYEDLSTVIICPTRGMFPTRVVQSWMKLHRPLNQPVFGPIFGEGLKVAAAYNAMIEYILENPLLNKCKYILTIEEDNLPPVDGLMKLYEGMKEYDGVAGLYWGKGPQGFPMIFGDPSKNSTDTTPQVPKMNEIQPCNGIPMGFSLFKMEMFKKMEKPWFKTIEGIDDDSGAEARMTQDMYFCLNAIKQGFKFAVNTKVLVGHYSFKEDKVY